MDGPFQCMATSADGGHATMFLSQLIPSGGAAPSAAMNSAWGDFVKATYKVQNLGMAVCRQTPSDPAIQQRMQDAYQKAAARGSMQLVNVNWNPGQNRNQDNPNTNPYAAVGAGDKGGGKDAPAADNQNQHRRKTRDHSRALRTAFRTRRSRPFISATPSTRPTSRTPTIG